MILSTSRKYDTVNLGSTAETVGVGDAETASRIIEIVISKREKNS
jgi:hypothetical protein